MWSSQAVLASIVLVEGNDGGVFVYNSSGHLVASMAVLADVDPQTTSNKAGVWSYDPSGAEAGMSTGIVEFGMAADTALGQLRANGGTAVLESGAATAADVQAIIEFLSKVASTTGSPYVNVEEQLLVSNGLGTPATPALLEVQGTGQFSGILTPGAGTNSSGSAPSPGQTLTINAAAAQLSDLTRDFMLYLTFSGAGNVTVQAGPTSSVARTIYPTAAVVAGAAYPVRMPAGWWIKCTGTGSVAIASQEVVGC